MAGAFTGVGGAADPEPERARKREWVEVQRKARQSLKLSLSVLKLLFAIV
jgi:hypothetical protein